MSYYEKQDQYEARGIDWDLAGCLEYNTVGIGLDEIAQVLATWEGENDGDDWRWVVATADGRYAFIQGGCDYTGWDCQSYGRSERADTAEAAALLAVADTYPADGDKGPEQAGMGHMLPIVFGGAESNDKEVYDSLVKQLSEGKATTWREGMNKEMG